MRLVRACEGASLIVGDCREALARFPAHRFDAVVTDPPYEIGFMGRSWDSAGVAFDPKTWAAVLRVLKPGGHLLAFGATRTYHRIAVAIEDAGFEIRDSLHWFYGTGFPKSLNVARAIDAARTEDLEPVRRVCRTIRAAMEARGISSADLAPVFGVHPRMIDHWAARDTDSQPSLPTVEQWRRLARGLRIVGLDAEVARLNARKGSPGEALLTAPVLGEHESAAAATKWRENVLGTAPGTAGVIRAPNSEAARQWEGWGTALKPGHEPVILARKPLAGTVAENVQRWGTGAINVDGCRIGSGTFGGSGAPEGGAWAEGSGLSKGYQPQTGAEGRWPANVLLDEGAAAELDAQSGERKSGERKSGEYRSMGYEGGDPREYPAVAASSGGASRFFYVAKPGRAERDLGCDHLPTRTGGEATNREDDSAGVRNPRAGANHGGGARNHHPTVKPIDLMRYLCRLVTPPGGTVLDPFTGSGTTGIAALQEGFTFVGCEQSDDYAEIARARIAAGGKRT